MRKTLCSLVLGLAGLVHAAPPMIFPWDNIPIVNEPDLPERESVLPESKDCEKIDLMFLVDDTGSMLNSIESVKFYISYIMDKLNSRYKDVKFALSTVEDHPIYPYGGITDSPYELLQDFNYDTNSIEKAAAYLNPDYGEDLPESYAYALRNASNESGWRDDAKRFIVFFADSTDRDEYSLREAVDHNNAVVLGIVGNPKYWRDKLKAVSRIGYGADTIIKVIYDNCKPLICYRLKTFKSI